MPRFQFVSPGAEAASELTKVLAEREAKRRQDMLDALTVKKENRADEIQRETLAQMGEQRATANEQHRQTMAAGLVPFLKKDQPLDPATADTLKQGNLGMLVASSTGQDATAALKPPPVADVPDPPNTGLLSVEQMGIKDQQLTAPVSSLQTTPVSPAIAPGDHFTGTPAEADKDKQKAMMQALIDDPGTPPAVKRALEYEMGTGKNAPAGMFDKPEKTPTASIQEYEYAKQQGYKGTYSDYQNEDANRKRPTSNTTNIFGADGKPTGIARNIDTDVQDVLEGKNTLLNIRMTMGRTTQTGEFMAEMRKRIHAVDSNFDFIASDAGGKSVSTPYVQRATAAIKGVVPNIAKFVELSNQVPRLGLHAVDALIQKGAIQIGNQKVTSLHQMQKLMSDEIGIALGAGNVSDMKLQLGYDVTDPNVPAENFATNMGIIREFLNNRQKGLDGLRYHSSTLDNKGGATPPPAGSPPGVVAPAPNADELRKTYGY